MARRTLLALWVGAAGCGSLDDDAPHWLDHLEADAPCYRVDLLDGLDPDDTTELHDLFACLNHHGHLAPLEPVDDVLDVETRTGRPVGLEAVGLIDAMQGVDLDPFALAGLMLDAMRAEDRPLDELSDLWLETTHGDRANRIRAGTVALDDPQALEAGVWAPLAPVAPVAARVLLDDPNDPLAFAGEVLAEPDTARTIRSVEALATAQDPDIAATVHVLLPHLGQALQASRSPDNDRWEGASGDAVRDLAEFFLVRPAPVIGEISPSAARMLGDPVILDALEPTIDDLARDGTLAALPREVTWLATVDVDGTPLEPGEVSALYRFVRLLAENNESLDCEIDLGLFSIQWTFGNLAVQILQIVADLEPGTVRDVAGILSDITDSQVTVALLEAAIDEGTCPSLTRQDLADLDTLEVLQQPQTVALLEGFIALLNVLEDGSEDHLPAFADLAEALYRSGGVEPTEELVRDVGDSAVVQDVVALVPVLADPASHGLSAGDERLVDLRDLLQLARWSFVVDEQTGLTGFERIRPLAAPLLEEDGTWVALANLSDLLADDRTQVSQLLALLPRLLALDPELQLLDELGPVLLDPALAEPTLRIAETDQLVDALLITEPTDAHPEAPLSFVSRLVVDGTLDDILALVDRLLVALE